METSGGGSPGSSGPNCAICLTEPRNTALLCGHQLCWDCAQKVDHCPFCGMFITNRIRLFNDMHTHTIIMSLHTYLDIMRMLLLRMCKDDGFNFSLVCKIRRDKQSDE